MKLISVKQTGYLTILTIAMLLCSNNIKAQVTIGAGIAPQKGALLELKEHESNDVHITAKRGLAMPRVFLTSKTNLFPMFEATDEVYQGKSKERQDLIHTGLLVFNLNKSESEKLELGLHVWNGKEWQQIGGEGRSKFQDIDEDDLGKVQGISGTWYTTRKFGKAGEWMIENLRETEYDEQTKNPGFPSENRLRKIHEGINNSEDFPWIEDDYRHTYAFYYYPHGSKKIYTQHPDYGLLYTYSAATLGMAADRFENDQEFRPSTVQGICPTGWVVPGDKDWSMLREEIQANLKKYTTNTNPNYTGTSVKSPMKVISSDDLHYNIQNTDGESKTYGFNVMLVGGIMRDKESGKNIPMGYGQVATFWSSTLQTDDWVLGRIMTYDNKVSVNQYQSSGDMYSVRCKKLERK